MAAVRDRIKSLIRVKKSQLIRNPKNWRTHNQAQRDAFRGILDELGVANALLVRPAGKDKYMILNGHMSADEIPNEEVPVLVLDVNEKEGDQLLAVFDSIQSKAGVDREKLKQLWEKIKP